MSMALDQARSQLLDYQKEYDQGEFDGNPRPPVLRLALSMHQRLNENGSAQNPLTVENLDNIISETSREFIGYRAQMLADYHGDANAANNLAGLKTTIEGLTQKEGKTVSAKHFERALHHLYNPVYTGHPVFSMTPALRSALAVKASVLAGSDSYDQQTADQNLEEALKGTFKPLNLDEEHEESMVAILNMRDASNDIVRVAMDVAKQTYPDKWHSINFMPTHSATWNPFDWDGRADVKWPKVMQRTTELLIAGSDHYEMRLQNLADKIEGDDKAILEGLTEQMRASRHVLIGQKNFYANYEQTDDPGLQKLAKFDHGREKNKSKLVLHKDDLSMPIQEIIARYAVMDEKDRPEGVLEDLVALRSDFENHALPIAQKHYRINSGSIRTALSNTAAHPDFNETIRTDVSGSQLTRINLTTINRLLDKAQKQDTNLKDLAQATETIAKQMIAIRQEIDDLDQSGAPVRFLIAEADSAIDSLGALFFAKQFGVEDQIDISPLIEDEAGIENAKEMFRDLLRNDHFKDYVKNRGRFCVQFGYSDSGRFLGQTAASAQLEKVQGQMIVALKEAGLGHLDAVVFDTNGEWMGRGAHPKSIQHRLRQLKTPYTLNLAEGGGIKLIAEGAFQGMDGFLQHGTKDLALSFLNKAFAHMAADHKTARHDRMYDYHRSKGDVLAFIETAGKAHLEFVKKNPAYAADYAEMIARYSGFLPKTGSRPVKRSQSSGGQRDLPRAIPHNGILAAQLGLPDNILNGVGEAIERDPELFENLMVVDAIAEGLKVDQKSFEVSMRGSKAFRDRMYMVEMAMDMSFPDVIQSYIEIENPSLWRNLAISSHDVSYRRVAKLMDQHGKYGEFSRITGLMRDNLAILRETRERLDLPDDPMKTSHYAHMISEKRRDVKINHAVRMSDMIGMFKILPDIPNIVTERHGITRDQIIEKLLRFQPEGLADLKEIFPIHANGSSDKVEFAKSSTLKISTDYQHFWDSFITPIEESFKRMDRVSHNMIHAYAAVG